VCCCCCCCCSCLWKYWSMTSHSKIAQFKWECIGRLTDVQIWIICERNISWPRTVSWCTVFCKKTLPSLAGSLLDAYFDIVTSVARNRTTCNYPWKREKKTGCSWKIPAYWNACPCNLCAVAAIVRITKIWLFLFIYFDRMVVFRLHPHPLSKRRLSALRRCLCVAVTVCVRPVELRVWKCHKEMLSL
jgi:hypothetical protein